MHWTLAWTALVMLHCAGTPLVADGAIRVLAFPRSPLVPSYEHPADARDDRPEPPDMVACLLAVSYTCLQRKTAVYLDALNRMHRIRLLGDFVTAVRTRPVRSGAPAISEGLLEARGLNDVLSLSAVVDSVVRDMVRDHAIKISFPRIAGLGGEPYEGVDHPDTE
uniref:Uncharacterized protein n=1 Tax=Sipha flava TaxID=143950 RepID=A0A2S2R0H5_9HEMI